MTGMALVRPIASTLWELRTAWATGQRVALTLSERCQWARVEGHITSVASTGAAVWLGDTHVPAQDILAVHNPSRLGDSDYGERGAWHGAGHRTEQMPGQLAMEL